MNAAWALAAALSLPGRAQASASAEREIRAVFTKVQQLLARQTGSDARTVAGLDEDIESLAPAVLRWKWRAVAPLAAIIADRSRPVKARLYALSFLGLTHDPLALPPLKGLLLDPEAPASLRNAAAASLPLLDVSRQSVRTALCAALARTDLPEEAVSSGLLTVSQLGCDETNTLENRAKSAGLRPQGRPAQDAAWAVAGLGQSRPLSATRALVRLLRFYPAGSVLRPAVLRALESKKRDMPALRDDAAAALATVLESESNRPDILAAALPMLAGLRDTGRAPLLRRFLGHPDAEVATAAAEALAQMQVFAAREDLRRILAGVHDDPRFAPAPGRPDPLRLIERIQAAEKKLR